MASLSVYLTFNLTASYRNEFVYRFFIGTYGVSALCLLLVNFLYAANLRQMGTRKNKIAKPLKRSRALMVIQCSTYLMINEVLEIVIVTWGRGDATMLYWLQIISILSSLLFYMWCFALYVINFYIARNLKNASYMLISVYVYLVAYLIPMLVAGVIVILSNAWYQGQHNHDLHENKIYWKALLLAIRLLIIYIMTAVNTYAFVRRLGTLKHLRVSVLTKFRGLCQTRKLRNGVLLQVIILLVWILNVMLAVQYHFQEMYVSKTILYLAVFCHSLLGPYFLVFEALSYSKELGKAFGRREREYALSGARFRSVINKQVGAMMWKEVEEEVEIDDMLLNITLIEALQETTL